MQHALQGRKERVSNDRKRIRFCFPKLWDLAQNKFGGIPWSDGVVTVSSGTGFPEFASRILNWVLDYLVLVSAFLR
jgi:hypothetical protein